MTVLAFKKKEDEINLQSFVIRLWAIGSLDVIDGFTIGAALQEPNKETSDELFFLNGIIRIRKKSEKC